VYQEFVSRVVQAFPVTAAQGKFGGNEHIIGGAQKSSVQENVLAFSLLCFFTATGNALFTFASLAKHFVTELSHPIAELFPHTAVHKYDPVTMVNDPNHGLHIFDHVQKQV
jgi:hypothetical protein